MKSLTLAGTALTVFAAGTTGVLAADKAAVLENYSNVAEAKYQDSLATAKELQSAVETLLAAPSADTLMAARTAWLAARVPYQQSEVFRFGNAIVDDWEGKVNAWPLDEGLIDYVSASYGGPSDENTLAGLNIIANPTFELSGKPALSPQPCSKARCTRPMV